MEKKVINEKVITVLDFICSLYALLGINIIVALHAYVPFFPVLFLFDFCLLIGYPLFLRFVLKRKWFECRKDKLLQIKYILLPTLFLEILALLVVIICYPNEILQAP